MYTCTPNLSQSRQSEFKHLLIMNSLAQTKCSRISNNKFYHSYHLTEIIQGIMEALFTKSSELLLRDENPICVIWIVAKAFYAEMYTYLFSIYQKSKHHYTILILFLPWSFLSLISPN